jgi:hypothetical protein
MKYIKLKLKLKLNIKFINNKGTLSQTLGYLRNKNYLNSEIKLIIFVLTTQEGIPMIVNKKTGESRRFSLVIF